MNETPSVSVMFHPTSDSGSASFPSGKGPGPFYASPSRTKDTSPVIVFWMTGPDQNYTLEYISKNISLLGYTPESLVDGRAGLASLVHPNDWAPLVQEEMNFGEGNEDEPERRLYRFRILTKGGRPRWITCKCYPQRDRTGRAIHIFGLFEVGFLLEGAHRKALSESYRKLRKSFATTTQALASIIDIQDAYTAGHQRKVARLSRRIGEEMGLDRKTVETVYLGASVHDIGKIGVIGDILVKPGPLNEEERKIVRRHPRLGEEILNQVELPWKLTDIVGQHHERLDGSGYPRGLKDGEISLGARIVAVADVVDAWSSDRPYRSRIDVEKALRVVRAGRGRLYDPDVVDACVRLFASGFRLGR